jgi:hypothetical protein
MMMMTLTTRICHVVYHNVELYIILIYEIETNNTTRILTYDSNTRL